MLIGAPFLILHAIQYGSGWDILGACVFIGCASLLYLGSTLYHAIPHAKAKNILAAAKMIQEKYGGKVPNNIEEILKIPGVARKTATVVLKEAYGIVGCW